MSGRNAKALRKLVAAGVTDDGLVPPHLRAKFRLMLYQGRADAWRRRGATMPVLRHPARSAAALLSMLGIAGGAR